MEWTNETIAEFLTLYEGEPSLWNSKNAEHKNKNDQHDAWLRIKQNLKGGTIPLQEIKKKRDSLMGTYRKLRSKVCQSIKSGSGTDEIYKPDWPFYNVMAQFLNDVYNPKKTKDSENGPSSSDSKHSEKTLEEIKICLRASEADKHRMIERIAKLEESIRTMRFSNGLDHNESSSPPKCNNSIIEGDSESERTRLKKELSESRKAKQNAEEYSLKLERIVTNLRSKFNGVQLSPNGPESLASESEHEANVRARRTSVNSSNNSTVVFGPVTDL